MAWYIYVVRCADGSLYAGISTDVSARVAKHNAGRGAKYTKARSRRPVALVASWGPTDRSAALSTEAAIKKLSKRHKERLIAGEAERGRGLTLDRVLDKTEGLGFRPGKP